jgi:hypothetical protein
VTVITALCRLIKNEIPRGAGQRHAQARLKLGGTIRRQGCPCQSGEQAADTRPKKMVRRDGKGRGFRRPPSGRGALSGFIGAGTGGSPGNAGSRDDSPSRSLRHRISAECTTCRHHHPRACYDARRKRQAGADQGRDLGLENPAEANKPECPSFQERHVYWRAFGRMGTFS